MKKTISFLSLSIAGILLFGWMLATPLLECNQAESNTVVADGSAPVPPPPWAA
jgi:hypothetical protein